MARKRSVEIRESLEELEQLRRYYAGKPQEVRMSFLCFLKEDPACSIIEASRKAGLSDRRGERLWGTYRKKGLQGVLQRREWGEKTQGTGKQSHESEIRSEVPMLNELEENDPLFRFVSEVAAISHIVDVVEWILHFRQALLRMLPDVDYVVVSVRHGRNLNTVELVAYDHIYEMHVRSDGAEATTLSTFDRIFDSSLRLLEEGKRQGFPYHQYHYPPACFDFYLDQERYDLVGFDAYVASALFFRSVDREPIATTTIDLIEKMRPFLAYIFEDFINRKNYLHKIDDVFSTATSTPMRGKGLSRSESGIMLLELYGHSIREIADILNISINTVKTHRKAVYKKLGVSNFNELFAYCFAGLEASGNE